MKDKIIILNVGKDGAGGEWEWDLDCDWECYGSRNGSAK